MNFKITDEEYAVLCEIRKSKSTSADRLKMMFFGAAEPALKNLEDYDLIRSDISGGHWYYYATETGMNYRHEEAEQSDIENEKKNNKDFSDDPTYIEQQKKQPFYMSNLFWTIVSVGVAVLFGVLGIVFR